MYSEEILVYLLKNVKKIVDIGEYTGWHASLTLFFENFVIKEIKAALLYSSKYKYSKRKIKRYWIIFLRS